ncbi:MAG: hypothetical protein RIM72_18075 [Alphaproteobacteria bacterium]
MVVGRAVNGWTFGWSADDVSEAEGRARVLDAAFKPAREQEPLRWVSNAWGAPTGYNTARSAFWRVIRATIDSLELCDVSKPNWPAQIVWSNLYKVSPFGGGNPSTSLCRAQQTKCIEMILAEVSNWKPRRLLFLTGEDWAKPFLQTLTDEPLDRPPAGPVQIVGTTTSGARIVVGPHPQSRPEVPLVSAITEMYRVA